MSRKNHCITVSMHPKLKETLDVIAEKRMSRRGVVIDFLIDETYPETQGVRYERAMTGSVKVNVCLDAKRSERLMKIADAWGLSLAATIRYIIFEAANRSK